MGRGAKSKYQYPDISLVQIPLLSAVCLHSDVRAQVSLLVDYGKSTVRLRGGSRIFF